MNGAGDALPPLAVRKIPHDGVTIGEINGVEYRRVDFVRPCGGRQPRHARGVSQPVLHGGIGKRPLQRARLQRRGAAPGAHDALRIPSGGKDLPGMRQLRQPQAGRLRRIPVVGHVGDDVEYSLGHSMGLSAGHRWVDSNVEYSMVPTGKGVRQQGPQLIQAEADPLPGDDRPECPYRVVGADAVAVGLAPGGPEQADALVEADARRRPAGALREFTDSHDGRTPGGRAI